MNDRFNVLKGIIIYIKIFYSLSYTGNHGCKILDVSHFLDLLNLA